MVTDTNEKKMLLAFISVVSSGGFSSLKVEKLFKAQEKKRVSLLELCKFEACV